jgi:hypothetical protein
MPAINGQDAQNEEVKDEYQCLSRRHRKMNPSHGTIEYFIVQLDRKSRQDKDLSR